MSFSIHRDFKPGQQTGITLDDLDLVFFHQTCNPVPHAIHDLILMSMGLGEIEAQALHLHAENRTMLGMVIGLRCLKEGFGWHASFVQTDPSELFLFHQ